MRTSSGEAVHALMSGEVSFEVEHIRPVAVVRPHGVLDAYTAADLRAVLLDCLAEQPTAIVVDMSRLTVVDDIGLTVLAGLGRDSQRWPGTRFVVSGGPELQAAATRMGIRQFVTVCRDHPTALAVVDEITPPPARRVRMGPDRMAPGLARLAVQEFCQDQGVDGDGDAAQLVASELVTNAVVHARTDIELTLRLIPPLLHIAVRDTGPGEARIADIVDESSPTGRGLLLVDALASAWGSHVSNSGKVVWATMRIKPRPNDPESASEQGKREI